MCQIVLLDKGVTMPTELLRDESRTNRHGWGLMTPNRKGTRINVVKGMDHENLLVAAERLSDSRPRAVHVRFATQGKVEVSNCHPFDFWPQERPGQLLLMHNGVVSGSQWDDKTGQMSDTAMFVKWLGQVTSDMELDKAIDFLTKAIPAIDGYSRFLLMAVNGRILRFGKWHWQEKMGVWTSTDVWSKSQRYYGGWSNGDWDDDGRYSACGYSTGTKSSATSTAITKPLTPVPGSLTTVPQRVPLTTAQAMADRVAKNRKEQLGRTLLELLEDEVMFRQERFTRWQRVVKLRTDAELEKDEKALELAFKGDFHQWKKEVWDPIFAEDLAVDKWTTLRKWAEALVMGSPTLSFDVWEERQREREAKKEENKALLDEWREYAKEGGLLELTEYRMLLAFKKLQIQCRTALKDVNLPIGEYGKLRKDVDTTMYVLETRMKHRLTKDTTLTLTPLGDIEISSQGIIETHYLNRSDVEQRLEGGKIITVDKEAEDKGGYETAPSDVWDGDEGQELEVDESEYVSILSARMKKIGEEATNYLTGVLGQDIRTIDYSFDSPVTAMDWVTGDKIPSVTDLAHWVYACPAEVVQVLSLMRGELRDLWNCDGPVDTEGTDSVAELAPTPHQSDEETESESGC